MQAASESQRPGLFKRVFCPALPSSKNWHALSTSIGRVRPKKYLGQSNFCSIFSTEFAEVPFSELIDRNGAQPSPRDFDGGKSMMKDPSHLLRRDQILNRESNPGRIGERPTCYQ